VAVSVIAALRAGGDVVLARVGPDHELGGLGASHRAGVGLDRHEVEAAAAEDPLVGLPLVLVRLVEPRAIHVEGVGVLHRELADPQEAGLGARLVAELGLDLVPDLGELPIAAQLVTGDRGEDLLVRHAEAVVGPLPVLEPEHVVAHDLPPAALLPDLGRMDRGEEELLAADGVHLLADDPLDLRERASGERQVVVDPRPELPDEAGADEELVGGDLRVGRRLLERGDEGLAVADGVHGRPSYHTVTVAEPVTFTPQTA
jgi:hypothetical protein